MNILILGAAGFIGTNLANELAKNKNNKLKLVDTKMEYFNTIQSVSSNVEYVVSPLDDNCDFERVLNGQDVVYHLVSTTVPSTSNMHISNEITSNITFTISLLEGCVKNHIKKVIFISSGGTVYGNVDKTPINEDCATNPITSYGVQKLMIEKLLYLYNCVHGLDYRIIRLANPYGPYQRPNGILGAVSTFTYKALKGETITVYGDGSVERDFIYIFDAIKAIITVASNKSTYKIYNVGCGHSTSIKNLLLCIERTLGKKIRVEYTPTRKVDVSKNYLDVTRYESEFGGIESISLEDGVRKTAEFMLKNKMI